MADNKGTHKGIYYALYNTAANAFLHHDAYSGWDLFEESFGVFGAIRFNLVDALKRAKTYHDEVIPVKVTVATEWEPVS